MERANPIFLEDLFSDVNGYTLRPLPGAAPVAGFSSNAAPTLAAIVMGNSNRTLVDGFLLSAIEKPGDAVTMAKNHILLAVGNWPVTNPPSVLVAPVDLAVALDGQATLSVLAGGSLPLKYQWRKNGLDLSDGPAHLRRPSSKPHPIQCRRSRRGCLFGSRFECVRGHASGRSIAGAGGGPSGLAAFGSASGGRCSFRRFHPGPHGPGPGLDRFQRYRSPQRGRITGQPIGICSERHRILRLPAGTTRSARPSPPAPICWSPTCAISLAARSRSGPNRARCC